MFARTDRQRRDATGGRPDPGPRHARAAGPDRRDVRDLQRPGREQRPQLRPGAGRPRPVAADGLRPGAVDRRHGQPPVGHPRPQPPGATCTATTAITTAVLAGHPDNGNPMYITASPGRPTARHARPTTDVLRTNIRSDDTRLLRLQLHATGRCGWGRHRRDQRSPILRDHRRITFGVVVDDYRPIRYIETFADVVADQVPRFGVNNPEPGTLAGLTTPPTVDDDRADASPRTRSRHDRRSRSTAATGRRSTGRAWGPYARFPNFRRQR